MFGIKKTDKSKHLFSIAVHRCKQTAATILGLYSQSLHSLLIGSIGFVHSPLLISSWEEKVPFLLGVG